MKCSFVVFMLLTVLTARAQFAVVNDPDGFVNVREGTGTDRKIIQQLKNGTVVYIFEADGNWRNIDYVMGREGKNGYVYANRVKAINEFKAIPMKEEGTDRVVLAADSIKITIRQKEFSKAGHKLGYFKDMPDQLQTIDGRTFWGTDGGMPATSYRSVTIQIGKQVFELPAAAYNDLYQPTLYSTEAHYDPASQTLYIHAENSDAAGAYVVLWRIEKGKYIGRQVMDAC